MTNPPLYDGVCSRCVHQGQVGEELHGQELVLHLVDHPALGWWFFGGVCVCV